jgi:hypothetical protein
MDEHRGLLMETLMFGISGGDPESAVARKTQYREDAKARWLCLTTLDLSRIKSPAQLITLVRVRYGLPETQAKEQVESWMVSREL